MRIFNWCWLLLILMYPFSGSASEDPSGHYSVTIKGSSTILPVMQALRETLEQKLKLHVHLSGGGSVSGLEELRDGRIDMAMVSRSLTEQELQVFDHQTIAYDGVALIVNAGNPLNTLSTEQVVDIYRGKIGSWKPLNDRDEPVYVLAKDQNRATREIFDAFFAITDRVRATRYVGSNTEMVVLVGTSTRAIGYVSIATVVAASSNGVQVKPLRLEGVDATMENVANGSWPLRRELNLVWKRGHTDHGIREVLDYMSGEAAQEIIAAQKFIPAGGGKGR